MRYRNSTQSYLSRWTLNDDGFLLIDGDNGTAVTRQLQAVLEERRLDRHKLLELFEGDNFVEQLIVGVVWIVCHDELAWLRHEVVVIQLVADNVGRHLSMRKRLTHTKLTMAEQFKLN